MTYNVFGGTLSLTQSINQSINHAEVYMLQSPYVLKSTPMSPTAKPPIYYHSVYINTMTTILYNSMIYCSLETPSDVH